MQYRLSTLFLIFFVVATSLALFAPVGHSGFAIWTDIIVFYVASGLNRTAKLTSGFVFIYAFFFIFFGIICPGLLLPIIDLNSAVPRRAICMNNLKQISVALQNYHAANNHFPPANICDKDGNPLFSWRAELLPMMEYGSLYDSLKKDEPWNSPDNNDLSKHVLCEYQCPSDHREKSDCFTNYIAIIGPGTAWHEDGPGKLSDLPDGGAHTVMVIEVANSGVHWAEPRDLTVEEALKGMKTGKGLHISSRHPTVVNILFADGNVRSMRKAIPISAWKKIFAGEVKDFDNIEENTDNSPSEIANFEPTDEPGNLLGDELKKWLVLLALGLWLLSIVLLFRRAIKSRPKPAKIEIAKDVVG